MTDTMSLREQIAREFYQRNPVLLPATRAVVPWDDLPSIGWSSRQTKELAAADIAIAVIASRQPSREEFDAWANDFMALDTDDDSENVVAFVRRCMASAQAFEGLMDRALIGDKT